MRTVIGENLQQLFAAREAGQISEHAFQQHKAALLNWSRGCLTLFTPRSLRHLPKRET